MLHWRFKESLVRQYQYSDGKCFYFENKLKYFSLIECAKMKKKLQWVQRNRAFEYFWNRIELDQKNGIETGPLTTSTDTLTSTNKIKLQPWPSNFEGPTGNTVTFPEDPSDDPCLIKSPFLNNLIEKWEIFSGRFQNLLKTKNVFPKGIEHGIMRNHRNH